MQSYCCTVVNLLVTLSTKRFQPAVKNKKSYQMEAVRRRSGAHVTCRGEGTRRTTSHWA